MLFTQVDRISHDWVWNDNSWSKSFVPLIFVSIRQLSFEYGHDANHNIYDTVFATNAEYADDCYASNKAFDRPKFKPFKPVS